MTNPTADKEALDRINGKAQRAGHEVLDVFSHSAPFHTSLAVYPLRCPSCPADLTCTFTTIPLIFTDKVIEILYHFRRPCATCTAVGASCSLTDRATIIVKGRPDIEVTLNAEHKAAVSKFIDATEDLRAFKLSHFWRFGLW